MWLGSAEGRRGIWFPGIGITDGCSCDKGGDDGVDHSDGEGDDDSDAGGKL